MKRENFFLVVFLAVALLTSSCAGKRSSSGGSRRTGSSGSSSGSRHAGRTTSRPRTQTHPEAGWNVPSKPNSNPVGSPPSYDSIHKTSGTHTQSSNTNTNYNRGASYPTQPPHQNQPHYQPSGGYNNHAPPPYSGVGGVGAGGYHSSPSYGGHSQNPPPYNPGYHPSSYPSSHGPPPPAYPLYNSYQGHSSSPGTGYNPPVGHTPQPIIVQSGSSSPGIGQLAKEAFVYAGVSAGVNAAVNRILPGGISGHRDHYYPSSGQQPAVSNGVVPTVTHTQITYNNYYNNGTSAAAAPAAPGAAPAPGSPAQTAPAPAPAPVGVAGPPSGASSSSAAGSSDSVPGVVPITSPENINNSSPSQPINPTPAPLKEDEYPSPSGAIVTKADLLAFTESLFENDKNNAFKHITVQLQGQKTDDGVKDDAPEPLLVVKDEAYQIPTIRAVLALHDNYALDVKTKETPNAEKHKEEEDMLDAFMETDVMKKTAQFLSDKGFLPDYEFRDSLKRIWFSLFKRTAGEAGSSGFETVFLAEKFDNEIIGMHNWIYYAKQEAAKNMNYLGYIKDSKLGTNGEIVKLRSTLNNVVQPVTTIFVGTSPELEMALYTMCFYVRPNVPCPIKLGGTEFIIIANAISYFGKDILISAFPEI